MNTLPKLSLLILIACFLLACNESPQAKTDLPENAKMVKSIYYGIHVDTTKYSYAADRSDIYNFKGKLYSLRQKAHFDKEGNLRSLINFKEEGAILYNESDLKNDPQLVRNGGLEMKQNPILVDPGSLQVGAKKYTINDQDPAARIYMAREKQPGMIRYTFYETY